MVLTAHGIDALIFWLIFFEIAILYFASSTLLRCRLATPGWAWLGFVLMVAGAITTNVAIFQGNSSVMMTSYVPMQAAPHFYLGLILFAVGALIGCFVFFGTLVIAKQENTYEGSIPLVTFGAVTAAIIAVFTIASGAIILVPTFLWSIGYIGHIDAAMYRWSGGAWGIPRNRSTSPPMWRSGISSPALFSAHGPCPRRSVAARTCSTSFSCSSPAPTIILVDPGISSEWKVFNTSYAMYLAVLASMIHGLTVPGSIEVAQRQKGFTNGMFEWLRKAPWDNPVFSGMFISLVTFGFIGGITGVVMGTEQINLIIHNTIYVPAHFHATVVTGTTLAFMALTYLLIPVLFRRQMIPTELGQAAALHIRRRHDHHDPVHAGCGHPGRRTAALGHGFHRCDAELRLSRHGLHPDGHRCRGGVLGVVGGAMFLVVTVGSLLFGKKLDPSAGFLQSFGKPLAASGLLQSTA